MSKESQRRALLTELKQVTDQIMELAQNPPPTEEEKSKRLAKLKQWRDKVLTDLINLD